MVMDRITVTPDRLPQSPLQCGTGLSSSKSFSCRCNCVKMLSNNRACGFSFKCWQTFRKGRLLTIKITAKPTIKPTIKITTKPIRRPPQRLPPQPPQQPKYDYPSNFDDDIFQTENTSLGKFEIINVQNRQNKKFKSFTNEFKVKIFKKLDNVKEVYHIFQEQIKTVKRR